MVRVMQEIGICSVEELLASDYREIRDRLLEKGIRPHLNLFYSIEMGLQDRGWQEITAAEKQEIRNLLAADPTRNPSG